MKFSTKELLVLLPAVLLAVASLSANDAFIVVPCLVLSWASFLWICAIHDGSRKWKIFTACLITAGFSLFAARLYYRPPRPLHPLSADEHKRFTDELRSQRMPRDQVRLGCSFGKEDQCLKVSQFIEFFKEAAWVVEHDEVVRIAPSKPVAGLVLFAHVDQVPEHLGAGEGVWVQQTPSIQTLQRAFAKIGIKVRQTADATMPSGTIGIYFGPDM